MVAAVADRVGHFVNTIEDYSDDNRYTTSKRFVNRWHLEKQDPSAALSPPKQPIVFWLENTIPVKYRDSIRDGVLMWNKAFEKIGFKNAIEVKTLDLSMQVTFDGRPCFCRCAARRNANSLTREVPRRVICIVS